MIAEIYQTGDAMKFVLHPIEFGLKLRETFVTLSGPIALRGKLTGLCGDYNQERTGEWRTAGRCAVSSGEIMATSFRVTFELN